VILFGKILCHHQRNSADQSNLCIKRKTNESTLEDIEDQINNLCNTDILYNDKVVQVKHTLIFSMVDEMVIFTDVFVIIIVILVK
jgi:hypothetical protein